MTARFRVDFADVVKDRADIDEADLALGKIRTDEPEFQRSSLGM